MKLTGITLETDSGEKITLTVEEAKALHRQLEELFGNPAYQPIPYPVYPTYPIPWAPTPGPYCEPPVFSVNSTEHLNSEFPEYSS